MNSELPLSLGARQKEGAEEARQRQNAADEQVGVEGVGVRERLVELEDDYEEERTHPDQRVLKAELLVDEDRLRP